MLYLGVYCVRARLLAACEARNFPSAPVNHCPHLKQGVLEYTDLGQMMS